MKNPFRSLPARIVAFVFGAVVLTSLTVMGLSIRSIDGFLRDEINRKFPMLLDTRAEALTDWYDQREREIEVFSGSEVLQSSVPRLSQPGERRRRRANDEIEQYMRYVLDGFRHFSTLIVLDPEGQVLLEVGAPVKISEPHRIDMSKVDTTTISDVQRLPSASIQIVSAPLAPGSDTPIGSLHAVFQTSSLRDLLAIDDATLEGKVLIVGRDRRIVVSSSDPEAGGVYDGPVADQTEHVVVSDYTLAYGDRFVGGALGLERFGWTLVVEEPYDQAFEPVLGAVRDVLLTNLAILVFMGIVTYAIARSIIRPIEYLSRAAQRISDGEKDVTIPATRSRDEVGVLTRAFSEMTKRLTQNAAELEVSHNALEEANTHLQQRNEELHQVNEVLEQLSITDGLTKLHNHRHFQEVLLQECKRTQRSGRELALILIDIDRFKNWNDRLGHAGGDEILRRIAEVLTEMVRDTDTLARYGGEEFALIAPNTDLDGARLLAEKIRATVAETAFFLEPPSEREPITVSIGVAPYDGDRVRMFNLADRALYLAKESGRDCVMTSSDLSD